MGKIQLKKKSKKQLWSRGLFFTCLESFVSSRMDKVRVSIFCFNFHTNLYFLPCRNRLPMMPLNTVIKFLKLNNLSSTKLNARKQNNIS